MPDNPTDPHQATPDAQPQPQAQPQPPAQPRTQGGFGRFVRHRATQIAAAGLAGLVIGGGAVALLDRDGPPRGRDYYGHHGPFDRRPHDARPYHGPRGDAPYWDGPRAQRPAPNPPPSAPPTTSTG